jgi:hypothetical protein
MSATTTPGNPAATDAGSGMASAETAISRILARDSGQPGRASRQDAPRQAPAPRGQDRGAPPEAEANPVEALHSDEEEAPEADDEELPEEGEAEEPEEEEAEGEEAEAEPVFTIKINGKTEQVPQSELLRGYQRHRDYTQKTMAFAEYQRAFAEHEQAVRVERAQYAELIPALMQRIQTLTEPNIDWDRLYNENPHAYVREFAKQQERQAQQQAAAVEMQRVQQISEQEARQERAHLLRRERELVGELVPAWRDEAAWTKAKTQAREYAVDLGYTDADIRTVTDHRAVMILWQAAQYAAMAKRGRALPSPAPVPQAAPPSPGPHPLRRRVTEHTRAKQRLAQSHSIHDAAAVIRGLL